MPIELRAVHTDKPGLAPDGHAATAAHAGTVDHDGVQRDHGRHAIRTGRLCTELHHDGRPDNDSHVRLRRLLTELLERDRHQRLASIRTVIGHDDQLIRDLAHLLLHDEEILVTRAHDDGHLVAGSLHPLRDRMHGCHADTAADTDDMSKIFNMCRLPERTEQRRNRIANLLVRQHMRRAANSLKNQRNRPFLNICIRNGQRNTFADIIVDLQNNKLARLAFACNQRSFNLHAIDISRQLLLRNDFIHDNS